VALAWLLSSPGGVAPILGATRPEQITEAAAAVEITLTPEEIHRLELPYVAHPILGHDQPRPARVPSPEPR
jgi:aryl-alcohol dehydrogenase-like predicted oxidoreductase